MNVCFFLYCKLIYSLEIVESSNRILAHPGGAPSELFRYSENAIRNSQLLFDGMEQEANQLDSVQQRERLLNAARINYFKIKIYI